VGAKSRASIGLCEVRDPRMQGNSTCENREALPTPDRKQWAGRLEKAMNQKSSMHVGRESDGRVRPAKCPNKDGRSSSAEGAEGRRPTKENTVQTTASQIQSWGNAQNGLHRVREAAKRDTSVSLRALRRQTSAVRAACRKTARADLCGGRWATGVPTATLKFTIAEMYGSD